MAACSADFSSRRLRGELNIASAALAASLLCIPTRTFSRAVMFWKRRMFWNVRPIPAFTMSLGRALRNVPPRRRMSRYQRGRTRAARSMTTSRAVATTSRMPARSGFPVATKATRASRATMPAGVTHDTGSNHVRMGLAIMGSPLSSTTPLVGSMIADDHVEEGRLAGAVGPDEADDRTARDLEIDLADCHQAAERLGHLGCPEDRASAPVADPEPSSLPEPGDVAGGGRSRSFVHRLARRVLAPRRRSRAASWSSRRRALLGKSPSGLSSIIPTRARP